MRKSLKDDLYYPQREDINADMDACFKMYHKELLDAGYEIKAMNIVKKERSFIGY